MVVLSHLISWPPAASVAAPSTGGAVASRRLSSYYGRRSILLLSSTSVGEMQLNLVDSSGNASTSRFLNSASCSRLAKLVSIGRQRGKASRAMGGSSNSEGSDDSKTNDVEVTDDTLRATIQKSKKVLELQKNLLQQIVERKKLVSSIKDDLLTKEQEEDSYGQSNSSFSSSEIKPNSGELHRTYNSQDSSGMSAQTSDVGRVGNPNLSVNKKSLNDNGRPKSEPNLGQSIADSLGLSREADLKTTSHGFAPSVITEPSSLEVMNDETRVSLEASFQGLSEQQDVLPDEGNLDSPPLAGLNVMNVILIAAECAPWSKTGGLADVSAALPKALARRGHRVMVVTPRYGNYAEAKGTGVRKIYKVDGQDMEVTYFHAFIDGVDFVFIDSPVFNHIGSDIYGGNRRDILKRMVLFCKAAVEVCWHVPCGGICYGDGNLVFIANDWHTALLPVYLKAYYRDNGLMTYTRCVLVIHNIAHQGRGPIDDFLCVDLPDHYMDLFRLYDPVGGEHFNIFAAGLKSADRIVTVSHGYSWELKTEEGGWGLHNIINENDWKFQGIVNGIDTKDWNPKFDVHLKSDGYTNYSLETIKEGKAQCKAALQRELSLPVQDDVPLICFIGRLDHQKGIDIIAEAMPWIMGQDVQLVMLGSGRQDLEEMLRRFENEYRDKVRGWVGFSVRTAHRLTAGSDILLMPSRFEPCGLNQLYAMMYGTIPVVHAVGGLRDTVQQFNPFNETGLGWTFDRAESNKLIEALGHCLNTYRNYKSSWEGLQKRGMMQDLSWDNVAHLYEEVLVAAKYQW